MKILNSDVTDMLGELRANFKEDKQWFAYEKNLTNLATSNILYFDTEREAKSLYHAFISLPIDAAIIEIEQSLVMGRMAGNPLADTVLIETDIVNLHGRLQWNYIIKNMQLEERMEAIDWERAFYDPLEAITEAETPDDISTFNELEKLVHDLQFVYASNAEGKQLVLDLTDKYWKDYPMEQQLPELFDSYPQQIEQATSMMVGESDHPISNEVLDVVQLALSKGENWMAYNNSLYFIDKDDVHFFKDQAAANEFARNNSSDRDHYNIIHITSLVDVLKQIPYGKELTKQISNNIKSNVMNEKNLEYLKDNVKYMGFGDKQNEALEQHLKEGKESFQLTFNTEVNKKPVEATLNFRKSDNSEMYFFNNYHASLQRSNGEKMEQTFYLNKGKGVTAKEAYNLLEGRSVYKELTNKAGDSYKAWIQLDFDNKDKHNNFEVKQYHENFGYDLKAAVGKYAVAELDGGDKEKALMQSLQKGNMQSITIEKDGATHKMFIEANPQYKSVHIYDGQMKRVQKEAVEQYQSVGQAQGTAVKPEQQPEVKPEVKLEKADLKAGKKTNDSLLPKKRIKQKKGLGVS